MARWFADGSSTPGRPRDRRHVSDYTQRLDALAIRREALADGCDPRTIAGVEVTHRRGDFMRTDRAWVVATRCPIYGVRLWLVCPRCGALRVHLFHTVSGVACRVCLRIVYADRRGQAGG